MGTFKDYINENSSGGTAGGWGAGTYGFGYKRLRTSRLHSPPTSIGADPLHHHHQMIMWQIQLANYIIHLQEANTLIHQNGKTYVLQRSLEELHPKAFEELHDNGVLSEKADTIQVYLVNLINQSIHDDAGIRSQPEMNHSQTIPDPHDPHGIRMVYTLPSNVRVHIWEPKAAIIPGGQGWRVDAQGWVIIDIGVYEISIENAQRMLVNLRNAEYMQQSLRHTGSRIWNQMTQTRLPQFHGTEFFGGSH